MMSIILLIWHWHQINTLYLSPSAIFRTEMAEMGCLSAYNGKISFQVFFRGLHNAEHAERYQE